MATPDLWSALKYPTERARSRAPCPSGSSVVSSREHPNAAKVLELTDPEMSSGDGNRGNFPYSSDKSKEEGENAEKKITKKKKKKSQGTQGQPQKCCAVPARPQSSPPGTGPDLPGQCVCSLTVLHTWEAEKSRWAIGTSWLFALHPALLPRAAGQRLSPAGRTALGDARIAVPCTPLPLPSQFPHRQWEMGSEGLGARRCPFGARSPRARQAGHRLVSPRPDSRFPARAGHESQLAFLQPTKEDVFFFFSFFPTLLPK